MKVKAAWYDINNGSLQINYGRIGDVVGGYCNYFSADPYLIMNEEMLEKLSSPFTIVRDDIKDVLIARNILNGLNLAGAIYTGEYKVIIDNDLPFGIIDVR